MLRHKRVDVANQITQLRRVNEYQICDPTLYEDCHRLHVQTSQLHECGKCCLRYKAKSNIIGNTKEKPSTDATNLTNLQGKFPKKTTDKLLNFIQICRFRSPWLERICKECHKNNKNLRFDICKDCREKNIPTNRNAQYVPYRPQPKTKISYSIRFDRENRFHSARPEINVRRNNP